MAVIWMQRADLITLDDLIGNLRIRNIHLFKNNIVPEATDILGDYVECDFDGYGPDLLVWSPAFVNPLGKGQSNAASITWVSTGGVTPNTVYGYFVSDNAADLMYAERFETPIEITQAGQMIFIQPTITCVTG